MGEFAQRVGAGGGKSLNKLIDARVDDARGGNGATGSSYVTGSDTDDYHRMIKGVKNENLCHEGQITFAQMQGMLVAGKLKELAEVDFSFLTKEEKSAMIEGLRSAAAKKYSKNKKALQYIKAILLQLGEPTSTNTTPHPAKEI